MKIANVICSPSGTYSVMADLSSHPDGNITLTLQESATGRILGTTSVAKDTVPPITAALAPPPGLNGLTTIVTNVDSTNTASYSFNVGAQSAIDCALDTGYSASIPVVTAISENVAMIPDGPMCLYLRGRDAAGNWQTTATILDWVKNTTVSTTTLSGLPSSATHVAAASGAVAGSGVTHYRMKFGLAASTDCALSSGYGAETSVATGVSVTAASGDGLYKLCVISKNAIGNWQDVASATSVSWTYDSAAPTLAIKAPAASSFVSSATQASLALTASCSENTRTVSATATSAVDSSQATGSGTCSGGTASVALTKDTQAPTLAGSVADSSYSNSLTASPTLTLSAASDASGSGVAKYQIAIGTSSGGTQALAWTDIGNVTSYQVTGLSLSDATTYYPQVRAVDAAGNISNAVVGDGWTTDATAPNIVGATLALATDDWSTTQSPTLAWTPASDSGSGLSSYEIAIGTAAGLRDVKAWASVGNVTSTTITGVTLTRGVTYFVRLRATDVAGNTSPVVNGANGWLVNHELWIANGSVFSVLKSGNTVYLGNNFSTVAGSSRTASPPSRRHTAHSFRASIRTRTALSTASHSPARPFTWEEISQPRVARREPAVSTTDGSLVASFNPSANGSVKSLLVTGSTLYVGGSFAALSSTNLSNAGALSTTDGSVISTFRPQLSGTVYAMALTPAALYLVGGHILTNLEGT